MEDNHLYNLITQLHQEQKSLWRINKMYKDDAEDCDECKKFWKKMEKDKEEHIEELKKLVSSHIE